jgi:signal peptidase I
MPVAVSEYKPAMGRTRQTSARRLITLRRPAFGIGIGLMAVSLIGLIAWLSATYRVNGISMSPGLRSGDLVLVDPFTRWFGALHRGEVVTVEPPAVAGSLEVKRIIGLPGDQLEIRSPVAGGPLAVYLRPGGTGRWRELSEPYLGSVALIGCCTTNGRATEDPRPFTVPPGEYFVMGDNRSVSYDSRDYGPVPRSAILEQVVWLITPFSHFGSVPISNQATQATRRADV